MAGLVLSGVAAAAGFMMGGPAGAQAGWMIGQAVFGGMDAPNTYGPKLGDLRVQVSTVGRPIAQVYGSARLAGNVIWSGGLQQAAHTQGGKGGGGGSQTNYTYSEAFACSICAGEITSVGKIWIDGALVYHPTATDAPTINASALFAAGMTIYLGTETQTADPTMQSYLGAANVPAYRGQAYVVFHSLQLQNYGNRTPNVEFEVTNVSGNLSYILVNGAAWNGVTVLPTTNLPQSNASHGIFSRWAATGVHMVPSRTTAIYPYTITDNLHIPNANLDLSSLLTQYAPGGSYSDTPPIIEPLVTLGWCYPGVIGIDAYLAEFISTQLQEWDNFQIIQAATAEFINKSPGLTSYGPLPTIYASYALAIAATPAPIAINQVFGHMYRGTGTIIQNIDIPAKTYTLKMEMVDGWDVKQIGGISYIANPTPQTIYFISVIYNFTFVGGSSGFRAKTGDQGFVICDGINTISGYGISSAAAIQMIVDNIPFCAPLSMTFAGQTGTIPTASDGTETGRGNTPSHIIYSWSPQPGAYPSIYAGCVAGNTFQSSSFGYVIDFNSFSSSAAAKNQQTPKTVKATASLDFLEFAVMDIMRGIPSFNSSRFSSSAGSFNMSGLTQGVGNIPLWVLVSKLCGKLDFAAIDATSLTDTVDGYVISGQMTARAALEHLQRAYFFDAVESDNAIKFVKRGSLAPFEIIENDLSAHSPQTNIVPVAVEINRQQEIELPRVVNVVFYNSENAYLQGAQSSTRQITSSKNITDLKLAVCMSDSKAKQIADVNMFVTWQARNSAIFSTSRKYDFLDPSDVVVINKADGTTYNLLLTKRTEKTAGVIDWEGVADDASMYSMVAASGGIFSIAVAPVSSIVQPSTIATTPPTHLEFLDIPIMRDLDDNSGYYTAANGTDSGWVGGALYKSADGGATYANVESLAKPGAIMGASLSTLGNFASSNIFDESNSVSILLETGTLSSTDYLSVLNGANYAVLGNEIIAFKNATLTAALTYTLTGLLRGRFGTEQYIGTHSTGDRFILADITTWQRPQAQISDIGLARTFKAVTISQLMSAASVLPFTLADNGLKPLAPVHIGGGRDAAGNITINWQRRSRIGGGWVDNTDIPLGETAENYSVDIMSGASVVRTLTSATQTANYTAAQQITDFGATQNYLSANIYQISANVGRGFAGIETLKFLADFASVGILIVGGGGSGATAGGTAGGGGGGWVIAQTVALARTIAYSIIVGAGGVHTGVGINGGNSSFNGTSALGGGGGGSDAAGNAGGNGGGGGRAGAGGIGSPGFNGGIGGVDGGGGGGGSGGVGANGYGGGGAGGIGLQSSISGAATYYGGGGGGMAEFGAAGGQGAGGNGGGGAGGVHGGALGVNGTSGLGGGGGGNQANGGSGAVILSYAAYLGAPSSVTGAPTVTTAGSNYVYTWTTPGTWSVTF